MNRILQTFPPKSLISIDAFASLRRASAAATSSPSPCWPATMSPTMPAPASCTRRPATAARTLTPGWMRRRNCGRGGIDTAIPFTVDDAGFLTKDAPGFGPDRPGGAARVIDDNGKKGDANKAVIDALIERGMLFARGRLKHSYPHSLALEEAGHLPQHAAMVRPYGQGTGRRHDPAHPRARRHRRDALRAGGRADPAARHDRRAAGLGAVAPARLGRADRRLCRRRRHGAEGRGGQRPHPGSLRGRRGGRLVRRRRARALSRQPRQRAMGDGAATFSTSGSTRARRMPSRWRTGPT